MSIKRTKGFTLIELLVAISIVGLLATLGMVALKNSREKARNTAVVANMKSLAKALELYHDDNGVYLDPNGFAMYINCDEIHDGLYPGTEGRWALLRPYIDLDTLAISRPGCSDVHGSWIYYWATSWQNYHMRTMLEPYGYDTENWNEEEKNDHGYRCDFYEIIGGVYDIYGGLGETRADCP